MQVPYIKKNKRLFVFICLFLSPVIGRFKVYCFDLVLRDAVPVRILVPEQFSASVRDRCELLEGFGLLLICNCNPDLESQQRLGYATC